MFKSKNANVAEKPKFKAAGGIISRSPNPLILPMLVLD
jgi:hypothetical protein